eukprot:2698325-Karenia_brevis.AAC.1
MPFLGKVLPRYGFEASPQGVAKMNKMLGHQQLALERQSRSLSSDQGRLALERSYEIIWLNGV